MPHRFQTENNAIVTSENMEEKQLKINSFNNCALYLILALLGIALIVLGVVMAIIGEEKEFNLAFCCPVGLAATVGGILGVVQYVRSVTLITDTEIVSTVNGKSQAMQIADLQRIVIYKFNHRGDIHTKIVFDDGTFNEFVSPLEVFSAIGWLPNKTNESWIAIDGNNKKIQLLKERFPELRFSYRQSY